MEFLDETISNTPIPRTIRKFHFKAIFTLLHGFSDASNLANGTVVYFRTMYEDTSVSTTILYSKSRVTPLKTTTIPRLELSVALLLLKILSYLQKIYGIQGVYAWSNCEIVLSWLRCPPAVWKNYHPEFCTIK